MIEFVYFANFLRVVDWPIDAADTGPREPRHRGRKLRSGAAYVSRLRQHRRLQPEPSPAVRRVTDGSGSGHRGGLATAVEHDQALAVTVLAVSVQQNWGV
ncbi:hypothetical protein [Rhodococcus sp. ACPA4]|uniref:hypothetical protein n=1 Tax=Rhodococcus sp. ACPA4 TaxID=2028571 RepID=UPI00117A7315|nr:hypothetical protein [Rhodococcus sp. ACPA4]